MQHIYNYVIKISKEFNDTFETKSGLKLYGNKDFSYDRLSNRYATIVGQPLIFDGELLDIGTEVLIDPSVYYHSVHGDDDLKQYTTNTIDRQKGIYSIEPQNIVLYKKENAWNGYLDNFLGLREEEVKEEKTVSGIIIESEKKIKTNNYKAVYINNFLKDNDVEEGDLLSMMPNLGISVWINGNEFTWLRSVDVLAKMELNEK